MVVYILNSLTVPFKGRRAVFKIVRVSDGEARELIKGKSVVSAVGHEASALALTMILQRRVAVDRSQVFFEPGDEGIALVLRRRLPEGAVIQSLEELEKIGYELFYIVRVE